jgi:hypothetical protein
MRRVVAGFGPGLFVLCLVVLLAMATSGRQLTDKPLSEDLWLFASFSVFVAVGTVLVVRAPENAVGWLLTGVGTGAAVVFLATGYASLGLRHAGTDLPGATFAAWLGSWTWLPMLSIPLVFLPLVFPDGRLLTPRWRWVAVAAVAVLTLQALVLTFAPTFYVGEAGFGFAADNPVGLDALAPVVDVVADLTILVVLGCSALAIASLVVRFRRAGPTPRRQLGWVLFASIIQVVVQPLLDLLPRALAAPLHSVALAAIPLAVGVAVTRYRLYELDRLVKRTLVYAGVVAVLLGIYVTVVVTLQSALRPITGTSDLAVAGSTLATAAAFGPVRARLRAAVDRRFDRSRYDARQTVERFGRRVRDEVELDALASELRTTALATVHPAEVTVWLTGGRHTGKDRSGTRPL